MKQKGFTLIEIAIVLVIIGLLLGGVLKGQELINAARVRNLISQQESIKAAFYAFQERYKAYPGDYSAAASNIKCATICLNGNGNGLIEDSATGDTRREDILAWTHLTSAGFLNGSFNALANEDAKESNSPKNPYSVFLKLAYDNNYGVGSNAMRHNLKTGNHIPVETLAEIDRKIDDGMPLTGTFQFSIYAPIGIQPPSATGANGCINGAGNTATWNVAGGATNCGAATLF